MVKTNLQLTWMGHQQYEPVQLDLNWGENKTKNFVQLQISWQNKIFKKQMKFVYPFMDFCITIHSYLEFYLVLLEVQKYL